MHENARMNAMIYVSHPFEKRLKLTFLILLNRQVDRPAPFFLKRNSTRIVLKSRNSIVRTSPKPSATTTIITTIPATELPKAIKKSVRRKITRNPNPTKNVQTTTTVKSYEQFSEGIDDDIASILPALTSAKPRSPLRIPTTRQLAETTTRAVQNPQSNKIFDFQQRNPSSFDNILQQQYKIKGIDVSEENYEEDERLIGVLGSQV